VTCTPIITATCRSDILLGTFRNPATFEGEAGFDQPASGRLGAMLAFVDVNAPDAGAGTLGRTRSAGAVPQA